MSSGIFFRVKRERWESVHIEDMTEKEIDTVLEDKNPKYLVGIIKRLLECEK